MRFEKTLSVEEVANACAVYASKHEKVVEGKYYGRVEFFGELDEHGVGN